MVLIIGGVLLLVVVLMLCIVIVWVVNYDMCYQFDYLVKEINIGEFFDDDLWSEEGIWDIDEEGEESDGEMFIVVKFK